MYFFFTGCIIYTYSSDQYTLLWYIQSNNRLIPSSLFKIDGINFEHISFV